MEQTILFILVISFLGPLIGSFLGVLKKPSHAFMHRLLAFASGVILSLVFLELLPESVSFSSVWVTAGGLVVGVFVMFGVEKLIPHVHPEFCSHEKQPSLRRTSWYLLLGIFLHNIPEGMALAVGTLSDLRVGVVVAFALVMHNVSQGIYTAAPFYASSGKRLRSFLVSSSTVIPLLVGFSLIYFVFPTIPFGVLGFLIGATCGLLLYLVVDELMPHYCSQGRGTWTLVSFILGVLFVFVLGGV